MFASDAKNLNSNYWKNTVQVNRKSHNNVLCRFDTEPLQPLSNGNF